MRTSKVNSAHSLAVSIDALYGAYLKANYPYEFYSTCLEYYTSEDNRDLEKISKLKQEMKYFNISLGKIEFGQNNTCFNIEKNNNSITQSLLGVKYLNRDVAEYLRYLNKSDWKDSTKLYLKMKEDKVINKRHFEVLTKIGYFDNISSFSKLILLPELYDLLYKNQFRTSDLEKKNLEFSELLKSSFGVDISVNIIDIINKYVNHTTAKTIYISDKDTMFSDIVNIIPEINLSLIRKIQYEIEFFGYVVTTDFGEKDIVVGQVLALSPKNNSFLFKNLISGNENWVSLDEGRKFPSKNDYLLINRAIMKKSRGRNKIFAIDYNIL